MKNNILHVVVMTLAHDNVYRKYTAASFDEVKAIRDRHPNHALGLFESPDGKGGEMWGYWPDLVEAEEDAERRQNRMARRYR